VELTWNFVLAGALGKGGHERQLTWLNHAGLGARARIIKYSQSYPGIRPSPMQSEIADKCLQCPQIHIPAHTPGACYLPRPPATGEEDGMCSRYRIRWFQHEHARCTLQEVQGLVKKDLTGSIVSWIVGPRWMQRRRRGNYEIIVAARRPLLGRLVGPGFN
jgi:hypothetical protein